MTKIDRSALFADETENYRQPVNVEPGDQVLFRFRTRENNVEHVYLNARTVRTELKKVKTENSFDYYETLVRMGEGQFRYFFEVVSGEERIYYSKTGITAIRSHNEGAFSVLPGFSTPDWAKGAVMYQIFVDRFRKGDPDSGVMIGEYFYGGRLVQRVDDWVLRWRFGRGSGETGLSETPGCRSDLV